MDGEQNNSIGGGSWIIKTLASDLTEPSNAGGGLAMEAFANEAVTLEVVCVRCEDDYFDPTFETESDPE